MQTISEAVTSLVVLVLTLRRPEGGGYLQFLLAKFFPPGFFTVASVDLSHK
jgi:hypothetical protein